MPGGKKFSHKASITNRPTCGGNSKQGLAPRATNNMIGCKQNHHFKGTPFYDNKFSPDYSCVAPTPEPGPEPEKKDFVNFDIITNNTNDLLLVLDGPDIKDENDNPCGLYNDGTGKLNWSEISDSGLENVICNKGEARGNNIPVHKCDYYRTSRIVVKSKVRDSQTQFNLGNKEGFEPTLAIYNGTIEQGSPETESFPCDKIFHFTLDDKDYTVLWSRCNDESTQEPNEEVDVTPSSEFPTNIPENPCE